MKNLKTETLFNIVNNDKLKLRSEDDLLELINDFYRIDHSWSICYEAVKFENVSNEKIREFIDIYNEDHLTRKTWLNFCERILQEANVNQTKSDRYGVTFQPKEDEQLCGIINHLCKNSKNIENEINISASPSTNHQPKTVIMYDNKETYYISENKPGCWLCIDFKEPRIIPKHCEFRTHNHVSGYAHQKNWIVEGSIDEKSWDELDKQQDCKLLNGEYLVHTFPIKNIQNKKYRYIIIRATGMNCQSTEKNNDNRLCFNAFEIYGTIL